MFKFLSLNMESCCASSLAQVVIDKHPVRFFVHKRPHVDFFLEVVSVWLWLPKTDQHCEMFEYVGSVKEKVMYLYFP